MGSDNNKKYIVGALVAGAVVGGAYFLMSSKKSVEEDDNADFAPATTSAKPAPAATSSGNSMQPTESSDNMLQRETTTTYSFSVNQENEKMLEEALQEANQQKKVESAAPKMDSSTGKTAFKNVGVSVKVDPGWIANEELSPMPNVAMITFTKPEFAAAGQDQQQMPGSTPVVILSIEDITSEGLDLYEFKEKSKNMALQQMMMMTGGMFQPQVTFDDTMQIGDFGRCLEYKQATPYFTMQVMNLLAVKGGLAYVFQLMGNPDVMAQYKPNVMNMAKSIELADKPLVCDYDKESCLIVETADISMKCPASWMQKAHPQADALITFSTASMTKTETISIYPADKAPNAPSATNVVENTTNSSGKKMKVASNGSYVIAVTGDNQANTIVSRDDFILATINSVAARSGDAKTTYFNPKHGYSHMVLPGGKIIESRLGDMTVIYAPAGIPDPQNPASAQDGPIVTIRVGDKTSDPDCESNVDEWYNKLKIDSAQAPIMELKKTKVNGKDCVTFINTEMQETQPGQREERQGRVYIFVEDGTTTLIRWETSTGNWRKFEKKLDNFVDSFTLLK